MSGLQRRRVAGASETAPAASDAASPSIGSDDFYENHRVGYDPQDISAAADDAPRLTLMEEVLLIGIKDRQGMLSFWNDSISYVLRGCILMELAFRGKIRVVTDTVSRRIPLADRFVELVDDKITGETLLDETLKIMRASEPLSVATWIDYLSGETWNLTKINYQLKQVRERLMKGLVDKSVLRTEKRNFFLFERATHPVADSAVKDEVRRRCVAMVAARTIVLPDTKSFPADLPFRALRSVALVCACFAANVLENVLATLSYEDRDKAFSRAEEVLADYSDDPAAHSQKTSGAGANLSELVRDEMDKHADKRANLDVVFAVLSVYSKLDSIL